MIEYQIQRKISERSDNPWNWSKEATTVDQETAEEWIDFYGKHGSTYKIVEVKSKDIFERRL